MNNIEILKRLYNDYTKKFLSKILISVFFSLIVAGSTTSIAWLLDPAIKKIFIEKDQTLIFLIPIAIVVAFAAKGASLYTARTILIKVAQEITKIMQLQVVKSFIKSDTEIIEKKHSGKFLSHLTFDISLITSLVSTTILNLTKDTLTLVGLIGVMFYQNWKLSLLALIMIPLASFAARSNPVLPKRPPLMLGGNGRSKRLRTEKLFGTTSAPSSRCGTRSARRGPSRSDRARRRCCAGTGEGYDGQPQPFPRAPSESVA